MILGTKLRSMTLALMSMIVAISVRAAEDIEKVVGEVRAVASDASTFAAAARLAKVIPAKGAYRTQLAERLMKDKDLSASLIGAWWNDAQSSADQKTSRFAGYIEGTLRVNLPKWWVRELRKSVSGDAPASVTLPYGSARDTEPKKHDAGMGYDTDCGLRFVKSGESVSIEFDGSKLRVLADKFSKTMSDARGGQISANLVTCCVTEKNLALCVYGGDWGGPSFTLIGFDRQQGVVAWNESGWALGDGTSEGPPDISHRLAVVASDDAFVVIGSERRGCYVEAYDAKTGHCQGRFATNYWMGPPMR